MDLFERKDIEKSFTNTIFARGVQYFRAKQVIDAWIDEFGDIVGKVKGTSSKPYEVVIELNPRVRFTKLDSDCSCPYGAQCKHAAAVALYALANDLRVVESDDAEHELDFRIEEEEELIPEIAYALPRAFNPSLEIPVPQDIRDWLACVQGAVADDQAVDPTAKQRVFYRIHTHTSGTSIEIPTITPITRSVLKAGGFGVVSEIKLTSIINTQSPKFWTKFDCTMMADMVANAGRMNSYTAEFRLDGRHGVRLLRDLLSSNRCVLENHEILHLGETRTGIFEWHETGTKGSQIPMIRLEGKCMVMSTPSPWYLDIGSLECGPIECGLPPELAAALIRRGPVQPEHISAIRSDFEKLGLSTDLMPASTLNVVVRAPEPVPCFAVDFEVCQSKPSYMVVLPSAAPVGFGKLTFEYDGIKAPLDGSDLRVVVGDELHVLKRNPLAERFAKDLLLKAGWRESSYSSWEIPKGRGTSLSIFPQDSSRLLEPMEKVAEFAKTLAPDFRKAGWRIDVDENFRFVPDSEVEWDISIEGGSGIDWFEFQLGIRVEGEPFDLKSVLAQLFREQSSDHLLTAAAKKAQTDDFFVFGLNGRAIKLSRKRLSAILQPLLELFGGVTEWPSDLRLPKALLPEIGKFEDSAGKANIPWRTNDELKRLGQQFASFDRLEPLPEPAGFTGQLRGYQREGLAWLQFLREYGFGGVLADDMGLGKTVQILAHIQTEKVAGRMGRPCLIVAPTSTMPNWRRECERFAPDLKVITLQGSGRSGRFASLSNVDIALTTYPLLARDKEKLANSEYHLLVLDEAQNVKNATTAAAKAARELKANHRICLSGTPVENHLGELWALFQFLMPGFLGTDADFKKRFRTPIEKFGEADARTRLARRIRPFMLRRTKSQVVKELPPKTEIIETVDFEDAQRDLYESIRIAMDDQVRSLIASQGFDKSRIQILDALLKLRQVCCDPRLVKLPSARAVTESAKLDRLIEMLGVLLEDGRRVLLFSQFTSMLDLIEQRLRENQIRWVRISGDTVDRETPVKQFQNLDVPLFLISLKAGGTGLNLTAADTVILYDPWWNPAVENQAIDRAHRIGQEKAVIVYKLVASGTIEEKMLEMQARKGDIAKSILTDDAEGIRTLTADDLRWVLSKE